MKGDRKSNAAHRSRPSALTRRRVVLAGAVGAALALALIAWLPRNMPDLTDRGRIEAGALLYARHCASCHGANLEGQPNWRTRLASGRMPAPPHDDTGHTWHHRIDMLFEITRIGMKPPYAPTGYESDMPAFGETLSDEEIWDVLAYIRSRWSDPIRFKNDRIGTLTTR